MPYIYLCTLLIEVQTSTGANGITATCLRKKYKITPIFMHRYLHTCVCTGLYLQTKKPRAPKGDSYAVGSAGIIICIQKNQNNKRLHKQHLFICIYLCTCVCAYFLLTEKLWMPTGDGHAVAFAGVTAQSSSYACRLVSISCAGLSVCVYVYILQLQVCLYVCMHVCMSA